MTTQITTTSVSMMITNIFRREFNAHPARRSDPALALQAAREAASAEIPAGVTGTFDDQAMEFIADSDSDAP